MNLNLVKNCFSLLTLFLFLLSFNASIALALPAFSRKEMVSCVHCHTNGSSPHLTKMGYLYRRAGFRFPENIGVDQTSEQNLINQHFSTAINVDYENITRSDPDNFIPAIRTTANQFNLPGLSIYPLVGGVLGNYGAFSEVDITPSGVKLTAADIRYVLGGKNFFINFRVGFLSDEGYGAGDQWIDNGNKPLLDTYTAYYNEDTLTLPNGAKGVAQFGSEIGLSYKDSHFTLGVYNGFDGTNGLATHSQSTLEPALMNPNNKNSKDYRLQFDQFLGDIGELTVAYYHGLIALLDPTNTLVWQNHYEKARIYATWRAWKEVLDIFAGQGFGSSQYVEPVSDVVAGKFNSQGNFVGFNCYVWSHLTLAGRLDYFEFATGGGAQESASGYAIMANLPLRNSIIAMHYNFTASNIEGRVMDYRLEWRLLF